MREGKGEGNIKGKVGRGRDKRESEDKKLF